MTHPLEPDYYSLGLMGWILSAHIVFTLVAAVLLLRDTARSGRSRILWLAALFLFPVAPGLRAWSPSPNRPTGRWLSWI